MFRFTAFLFVFLIVASVSVYATEADRIKLIMNDSRVIKQIDTLSKEEIKELGKALNTSLHNQLDLLNTLLDWSRWQTGDFLIKSEAVPLNNVISDVMQI